MDTVFKLLYLQRNILNFLQEKWGFFYFILILSGAKKKKKKARKSKILSSRRPTKNTKDHNPRRHSINYTACRLASVSTCTHLRNSDVSSIIPLLLFSDFRKVKIIPFV